GMQRYIDLVDVGFESADNHVAGGASNHCPNTTVRKLKKKIAEEMKDFYQERHGFYVKKIVKQTPRLCIYEMMLRGVDLEQYDVFHAQDRFTANVLGRLNQMYQKPLFFTPHGF